MNALTTIQSTIIIFFVYGIAVLSLFIVVIFIGNVVSRIAKKLKQPKEKDKLVKEILKDECKEMRYKKINLGVFVNEMYCVANTLRLFLRQDKKAEKSEYIILLETDKGNLVEQGLDSFHAYNEFAFISEEDKVQKEGANVTINVFSYKMFDKNLEKELVNQSSTAA